MRSASLHALLPPALLLAALSGCGPSYSPNTYSSHAVQQANKVEEGVVVGVRQVKVSVDTTSGMLVGGAAGGIAGAQTPGSSAATAFGTLGGVVVGGLVGSAVQHGTSDTKAYEYIVRKANNDMLSVTQQDTVPLALEEHVLVITGTQARVVPDYTIPSDAMPMPEEKKAKTEKAATTANPTPPAVEPATPAAPAPASPTPAPPAPAAQPALPAATPAMPAINPAAAAQAAPAAAAPQTAASSPTTSPPPTTASTTPTSSTPTGTTP